MRVSTLWPVRVTASAPGVSSRTIAATTVKNKPSSVGVTDLDLQAVVEPVLKEALAIRLKNVRTVTSPRAASMPVHRNNLA